MRVWKHRLRSCDLQPTSDRSWPCAAWCRSAQTSCCRPVSTSRTPNTQMKSSRSNG